MRVLKMLLLFPFITAMALWHSLVMFVLTFVLVWKMLRNIHKERYL
jgi:hypothetical protein